MRRSQHFCASAPERVTLFPRVLVGAVVHDEHPREVDVTRIVARFAKLAGLAPAAVAAIGGNLTQQLLGAAQDPRTPGRYAFAHRTTSLALRFGGVLAVMAIVRQVRGWGQERRVG